MPKWEIGKTYKTVDGLDAKLVYKMDEKQDRPLIFVITGRNGHQFIAERDEQGRLLKDQIYSHNVVPPDPDKTSRFVNVYHVYQGAVSVVSFDTYNSARYFGLSDKKGVLEIQFEDGEYVGTVFHPNEEGK